MVDRWLDALIRGKCLPEDDLFQLCERAKALFMEENNVQLVHAPVIICGNIHGQFYDLQELFRIGGSIPEQNYIFMGDYVNRGYNSVETFEFLLALKVKYPHCITLLRGNNESRQRSQLYGFYEECVRKHGNSSQIGHVCKLQKQNIIWINFLFTFKKVKFGEKISKDCNSLQI